MRFSVKQESTVRGLSYPLMETASPLKALWVDPALSMLQEHLQSYLMVIYALPCLFSYSRQYPPAVNG
jgi:hypothetical protein